jgi:NAD(P)-dependent dehydrogenase (short-subunit alcohol dehydrogenase family)
MTGGERLRSKVAIVTGGSSGIGAETARQFAAQGAFVLVADVEELAGESVVAEIADAGGRASFSMLDVVDEAQWQTLVGVMLDQNGRLDVLANIAGVTGRAPPQSVDGERKPGGTKITEQTLDVWNRVMDVNATGSFLGTKHGARAMTLSGGGSIINISSIWGLVGSSASAAYHASKGAVRQLTKAAAVQCASDGVRVNAVYPGFVQTPMTQAAHASEAVSRERIAATPLGRFGTPYDVAMGCVYLASDEAAWVTGSELVIDGGFVAR